MSRSSRITALIDLGIRLERDREETLGTIRKRDRKKMVRIVLASAGMGVVIWFGWQGLMPWFDGGMWLKIAALAPGSFTKGLSDGILPSSCSR